MFFSLFLKPDVNTNLIQMTVSYCFCYLVSRQWCPAKRGLWFTCHLTNVFSDSIAIRTSSDWSRQYHWSDKNGVKMASPCSQRATDWQQYIPQFVKKRLLESYLKNCGNWVVRSKFTCLQFLQSAGFCKVHYGYGENKGLKRGTWFNDWKYVVLLFPVLLWHTLALLA